GNRFPSRPAHWRTAGQLPAGSWLPARPPGCSGAPDRPPTAQSGQPGSSCSPLLCVCFEGHGPQGAGPWPVSSTVPPVGDVLKPKGHDLVVPDRIPLGNPDHI